MIEPIPAEIWADRLGSEKLVKRINELINVVNSLVAENEVLAQEIRRLNAEISKK